MEEVINANKTPIKLWTPAQEIESVALDQLKNLASLPFIFKHVAAMPDVHFGKGATVGSVIATKGAVIPAAVGVDIGCGMMAVKTALKSRDVLDILPKIRASIERSVPLGRDGNRTITSSVDQWKGWETFDNMNFCIEAGSNSTRSRVASQLGSLGGGNHFIEICLDTEDSVWVMLHSGSRNIGKTVAEFHIDKAKSVVKQMFISLPDPDLAYFAQGTKEYAHYMNDLQWCQDYAFQNRIEMMNRTMKDLSYAVGKAGAPLERLIEVNCHHNYATMENHFDENVLVTRKGAVRARKDDYGIIPGSMGTKSYIVKGLGNAQSFCSCSHGAGRKMSRSQARKQFTKEDLAVQTAGVDCRKDEGVIDEIPGAYKDIDQVMEYQKDLVEVVATLKQIVCVKG